MLVRIFRRISGPMLGAAACLTIGVPTALAGSGVGAVFNLGEVNTVNAQTTLSGNAGGNPQLRVENNATVQNAFGVLGRITAGAPAGQTAGLRGINSGTNANGFGVWGFHQGSGAGVFGETPAGIGVLGKHTAGTGNAAGVHGETASDDPSAAGVRGLVTSTGPDGFGVMGMHQGSGAGVLGQSLGGIGVWGRDIGTSGFGAGVRGETSSTVPFAAGVLGTTGPSADPSSAGVKGEGGGESSGAVGTSPAGTGVVGEHTGVLGTAPGVRGETAATVAGASGVLGRTTAGEASNVSSAGVRGVNDGAGFGVFGQAGPQNESIAVFGQGTLAPAIKGVTGVAGAEGPDPTSGAVVGIQQSPAGTGVFGQAGFGGIGVFGKSDDGLGVQGESSEGSGVFGVSSSGVGVEGTSSNGLGGLFHSDTSDALQATATGATDTAVLGQATGSNSVGVEGVANAATGVGVFGASTSGLAGKFEGQVIVNGRMGVGSAVPTAVRLHVARSVAATAAPANHVALIESTSTAASGDVLALKVNPGGSASPANPDSSNNFITFYKAGTNNPVGALEGNGSGGVQLFSGGGDYAELLPRLHRSEAIRPGDIVGVFGGKLSKETRGADQLMVVTNRSIVVGNDPGPARRAAYAPVAFVGQVDARVRGPVHGGDLVVASGFADGTGIAVAPKRVTGDQFARIVGRAWETSATPGVKRVRVAVGLDGHGLTVERLLARYRQQQTRLGALHTRLSKLEQQVTRLANADEWRHR